MSPPICLHACRRACGRRDSRRRSPRRVRGRPLSCVPHVSSPIASDCWRRGRRALSPSGADARRWLAGVVVAGFCGRRRAARRRDAWQRAWRPPLRRAFEELARARAREAERGRPRVPEDDGVRGRRRRAARGRVGRRRRASRSASTSTRGSAAAGQWPDAAPVSGGRARVTVVGLARRRRAMRRMARRPPRAAAGRSASAVALSRSAACPTTSARCAMRGTSLVGTVEERRARRGRWRAAGWIDERDGGRARVRAARHRRRRRPLERALGRRSSRPSSSATAPGLDDEVQRRLQEAGTYHVIAISGGNIAILAGLMLGGVPARRSARPDGDAGVDRRCWSRTRRWSAAARRSIARR